jgi:hypothetical protein
MPRRRLIVALAGAASVFAPAATQAQEPAASAAQSTAAAAAAPVALGPTGSELAVRSDSLADDVTARWALLQRTDGRFPDPVAGNGEDYGTAMLGLAMARRGAERGDRELVRGGLAAILAVVERPTNGAFEPLVLADVYRWGTTVLAQSSGVSDLWPPAEARLRADLVARPPAGEATVASRCLADAACWNNLKLVGALAGTVMQRTGLTSQASGAILADPALATNVLNTVGVVVPGHTGDAVDRHGAAALLGGGVLSDPPRDPLAYHVLSTVLLGRLVDELGAAAPLPASRALQRANRALLLLAAPNGDLSWWGRGQGQMWVHAVAAEAAARAALRTPVRGSLRGRYLALAAAELARLRDGYGVGAYGLPLIPGATDAAALGARSVDSYATTRGYNGLALDALDRTTGLLAGLEGNATTVSAVRDGSVRSPRQAGIATITRRGIWVAISGRPRAINDARYGSGLLALQAQAANGAWTDRIPGRPSSPARTATLAIRDRGALLPASGDVRAGVSSSSVSVFGGWAAPGLGRVVDPGTLWRWSVGRDGVITASFVTRRARTVVATGLAGDGDVVQPTRVGMKIVRADGTSVSYALRVGGRIVPLLRATRAIGGSAFDASVRALEVSAFARSRQRVELRIRAEGATPIAGG